MWHIYTLLSVRSKKRKKNRPECFNSRFLKHIIPCQNVKKKHQKVKCHYGIRLYKAQQKENNTVEHEPAPLFRVSIWSSWHTNSRSNTHVSLPSSDMTSIVWYEIAQKHKCLSLAGQWTNLSIVYFLACCDNLSIGLMPSKTQHVYTMALRGCRGIIVKVTLKNWHTNEISTLRAPEETS